MNSALIKIGAERISTAGDQNNRARLVSEQYPKIRDALLRAHPWKFAIRRVVLAPVADADIDPDNDLWPEFTYVYQLPSDVARVLGLIDKSYQEIWDVEDQYLLANTSPLAIRYVKQITDVTKFDDSFCEVLAWAIATDIAFALTGKEALAADAEKKYKFELSQARSFNAQQGSVKRVISDEWDDARRY